MRLSRLSIWSVLGSLFFSPAQAEFINWVNWTDESPTEVTGNGVDDGEVVTVTYLGTHVGSVTSTSGTDTYYWDSGIAYTDNPVVDNKPPDSDIIGLNGGPGALTHTVTFSQAVLNPVMAILSLGRTNAQITYNFDDEEFNLLSSGPGHWGGGANSLSIVDPGVLTGVEGHGVIQFVGSYTELTWTVPTPEFWHGFTIGFEGVAPAPVPLPAGVWFLLSGALALGSLRRQP